MAERRRQSLRSATNCVRAVRIDAGFRGSTSRAVSPTTSAQPVPWVVMIAAPGRRLERRVEESKGWDGGGAVGGLSERS